MARAPPAAARAMARLDPDLLAFVGDQFYESTGGYGAQRAPLDAAILDYLRKWFFHGWTWRELMRDRPSISLPDDHDVYQGNLWGEGGEGQKTTQEAGGYELPAAWVNVVHRTQTAHHPDAYDPKPSKRDTINYYGLQPVSKFAREAAEFVNLYSKSRGINRFPALVESLEWLNKRPEVKARGFQARMPKGLIEWMKVETKLGNPALKEAVAKTGDPDLKQALDWSVAVNKHVDSQRLVPLDDQKSPLARLMRTPAEPDQAQDHARARRGGRGGE